MIFNMYLGCLIICDSESSQEVDPIVEGVSKNNGTEGSLNVLSLCRRDTTEFEEVSVDCFSGDDIF